MPRGDEREEYRFADGDDDSEDLGYGGGGAGGGRAKYDDDDEDEGGWATHRETDDLWDSADDMDEDEEGAEAEPVIGEGEEEEEDAFGRPARAPRGSAGASAKPAAASSPSAKP